MIHANEAAIRSVQARKQGLYQLLQATNDAILAAVSRGENSIYVNVPISLISFYRIEMEDHGYVVMKSGGQADMDATEYRLSWGG